MKTETTEIVYNIYNGQPSGGYFAARIDFYTQSKGLVYKHGFLPTNSCSENFTVLHTV